MPQSPGPADFRIQHRIQPAAVAQPGQAVGQGQRPEGLVGLVQRPFDSDPLTQLAQYHPAEATQSNQQKQQDRG
ncbi:hypothetical protein D3C76_1598960 [compost metagenome]